MVSEQRKKSLKVFFHTPIKNKILWIIGCENKLLKEKYNFPIELISVEHKQTLQLNELKLSFAESHHIGDTTAIRIDSADKSFCYSADGQASNQALEMYKNSNILIQETYFEEEHIHGHANIPDAINYANSANIKNLALVHINRFTHRNNLTQIKEKLKDQSLNIFIPETFEEYKL